ncbi:MAG: purine-cytosine permease family protein [Solirubrobacteraceae bacterium]
MEVQTPRHAIEDAPVPANIPKGIEANGINSIPEHERKGHPRALFLPWFASNVGVFGISYGAFALTALFGLSLWQGIISGVIGIVVSFILVGIVAIAGPRASAPTMIISRAAFGVRGNRVAAILSWILNVGWETSLVVVGTLAFAAVCTKLGVGGGTDVKIIGIAIILVLTILGGVAGFDLIMRLQGVITVVAGVLTVLVIALTVSHVHMSVVNRIPNGSTANFIGMIVFSMVGFGLGWVYSGADYSRYLPRKSSPSSIIWWTTFGAAVGPVILFVYGVLLAGSSKVVLGQISGDPIGALTAVLPHWFLVPFIVLTVLGLVGATVLDIYSSGLNLQSAGLKLPRYQAAAIDGTIMTGLGVYVVFFTTNFLGVFQGFLITLGVPIAAWAGIVIADTVMRRRDYAITDLYDTAGRYGDLRVWPMLLLVVGSAVGFGLVVNTYAGWLKWQGYLLGPLGLGGKSGTWANASIGVIVALAIGLIGTLFTGGQIKRQEAIGAITLDAPESAAGVL